MMSRYVRGEAAKKNAQFVFANESLERLFVMNDLDFHVVSTLDDPTGIDRRRKDHKRMMEDQVVGKVSYARMSCKNARDLAPYSRDQPYRS